MKKSFITAAAIAVALTGPLAGVASAQQYNHERRSDSDRNDRRRDYDRRDNDRRGERWGGGRYNGYTYNGRWYFGQPSAQTMGQRGYSPGYHAWRRGDRLAAYERAHYRRVDYRREHLRMPPRGYEYRRGDRGELLLVGVATGVILSVLLAGN